jgi:glucokinase
MGFSPASALQAELWHALFAVHARVGAESVASGTGLGHIYEFLRARGKWGAGTAADPAWVSAGATERRDPHCIAALALFTECLGNVAGEHAIGLLTRGGVYLTGGVIAKIAPALDIASFRAAFCAKGQMASILMRIPVRAVTNERLMLLGAARIAQDGV